MAVAEAGSIQKAADRLNLTQPAVTRQIQRLESQFEVVLLNRRSKPLVLTPSGKVALAHCRRVLDAVKDLSGSLAEEGEPSGDFRLGVSHGASQLALAEPIDALRARFPELSLRVTSDWSRALIEQVGRGALDAAVILQPPGAPVPEALQGRAVGCEQASVLAARWLDLPPRPSLEALSGYGWVVNPEGCGVRAALGAALDKAKQPFAVAVEVFGQELQTSLVARGVGLGLGSRQALERCPLKNRISLIEPRDFQVTIETWVIRGRHLGQAALAVDSIEDSVQGVLGFT